MLSFSNRAEVLLLYLIVTLVTGMLPGAPLTPCHYLRSLLFTGELSAPQDAMLRSDQQEAVSAVQ